MSIHVREIAYNGRREFMLYYPGMTQKVAQHLADKINGGNYNAECERDKLAGELVEIREERDFLKEALDAAIKDARYFEAARDSLRNKVDNGIRTYAYIDPECDSYHSDCSYQERHNATLILDEGIKL